MAQKPQIIEETAPTIEEAIAAGLARLGLSEERVDVEVIEEGRKGLFGMGGREAVVRLHVRSAPQREEAVPAPPPKTVPQVIKQPARPAVDPPAQTAAAVEKPPAVVAKPAKGQKPAKAPKAAARPVESDAQEADVARQVVESMLLKMDVTAQVTTSLTEPDDITGRQLTVVNINGDDLAALIGARGEVLDAMQHMARLMVGHQIHQRAYFVLDVDGYREQREQALSLMAQRMGKKAVDRGRPVTLEPMPANERRIIHMALREDPQVRTESTGEGERRKVRIYPL